MRTLTASDTASDVAAWERAMMLRVAAGDSEALAAIYDQYAALVHGIARRLVGEAGAPDVCQEVFIALWRQPDRFDSAKGSLRTFLATIARRRSVDALRQSGRREAREERAMTWQPQSTPLCAAAPNPEDLIDGAEIGNAEGFVAFESHGKYHAEKIDKAKGNTVLRGSWVMKGETVEAKPVTCTGPACSTGSRPGPTSPATVRSPRSSDWAATTRPCACITTRSIWRASTASRRSWRRRWAMPAACKPVC